MGLALKCDFCKSLFAFKDKTSPNVIGFGHIYENGGNINLNTCYNVAPNIIKKNAHNEHRGTYSFIVCNKCVKRIMNLIVEEEENDD